MPLDLSRSTSIFHALSDETRLAVLEMLGDGERCVCDLQAALDVAQSRLSFHLKVMREAGLIEARVEGRWIYYRLRREGLDGLQGWLGELAAGCSEPAAPCG